MPSETLNDASHRSSILLSYIDPNFVMEFGCGSYNVFSYKWIVSWRPAYMLLLHYFPKPRHSYTLSIVILNKQWIVQLGRNISIILYSNMVICTI